MITKSAQNRKNLTKNLVFTHSARSAWQLIIESVKKSRGLATIMLPAYIGFTEREGSGIFDPVEATNAEFKFYNLNQDLSVDIEQFTNLAESGIFNIAFVVHYFGFCRNDMDKIKSICEKNNILLVEDCAHAFQLGLKTEKLGVTGDFAIYSIHKHLATESGGVLRYRPSSVSLLELPKEDCITLEPALQLLNSDLEAIAAKRKKNFESYSKLMAGVEGIEPMYELNEGEVPQTFPVRVKNGLRESLYFYLMEKNMPTIALYYRLIEKLDAGSYPLAHEISGEILNLPLHQDIDQEDIFSLAEEIKKFMRSKS